MLIRVTCRSLPDCCIRTFSFSISTWVVGLVRNLFIFNLEHNDFTSLEPKLAPWSVIIKIGTPNWDIQATTQFAIVSVVWSASAYNSAYLVYGNSKNISNSLFTKQQPKYISGSNGFTPWSWRSFDKCTTAAWLDELPHIIFQVELILICSITSECVSDAQMCS